MKLCNTDVERLGLHLARALTREKNTLDWRIQCRLKPGEFILPQQRDQAVSWLIHLCDKLQFLPETFTLSVSIFDEFLSSVKAHPRYLRCIVTTCLYLAAKIQEEDEVVPGTYEFVKTTDCGCTVSEVLRMERVILDKLQWQINSCTALDFLHIFHAMLLANNPQLLGNYSHLTPAFQLSAFTTKLKLCLAHYQLAIFRPATLALALLSLEMEFYTHDWLTATCYLQQLAAISSRQLIHCRENITACYSSYRYKNIVYRFSPEAVNKRVKRHLSESEDDPDKYDGIKRLYSEEMADGLTNVNITPLSCSLALQQEQQHVCPALKSVEVN